MIQFCTLNPEAECESVYSTLNTGGHRGRRVRPASWRPNLGDIRFNDRAITAALLPVKSRMLTWLSYVCNGRSEGPSSPSSPAEF